MDCHTLMDRVVSEYEKQTEYSKIFDKTCAEKDKLKVITLLVEKFNCDFESARMVCDCFIDGKPLPSTLSPQQQAHNQAVAREALNKPKCRICGSTNIKRISTTAKAVNVAMFGLLGNKRKYQWHCNNCKSDF